MPYRNMREFIAALEETGDVVRVRAEVDWDREAGAISRRAFELGGPALWFERVKGYLPGFTLFNGPLGTWRRVAVALGLSPHTPVKEIYAEYERREKEPIKPQVVSRAPCQENVLHGPKVDLYRLPAPMVHEGDGGRYIGTWDLVVSQDPDTGWTNWGMYRMMIHNRNTLAAWPQRHSHLGMVLQEKYLPKGQPMPVALVIGADPLSHMVATEGLGIGVDEADYAGALLGEPVELVKCRTIPLLVPAQAEIVIEGEIPPDETISEGPFGEYPGYRSGEANAGVMVKVKAITFRNSPILTMTSLGVPVDDSSIAASLTAALAIKRRLLRHGLPVTQVFVPPEGATHLIVVGVKQGGVKVAREVLDILTARRVMVNKIIVVDEDVDPFNMAQVIHAFATKCHPGRGILVAEYEGKGNALTPCYDAEERRLLKGATVAFDATWPLEWDRLEDTPLRCSFDTIYSQEVQEQVLARWREYGLP